MPGAAIQSEVCRGSSRRFLHGRRGLVQLFSAAVLTVLLIPAFALAVISLDARVGFHGVFQLGKPFPLEIEIDNRGQPVEGLLEVQIWKGGVTKGGAPYPVKYQRELFVGAQARKTAQFTIDPDFLSRPLAISFTGGVAQARRELDLRRNFAPAPLMLLINDNGSLPPIALAPAAPNRLVTIALNELAGDGRALLGVSHMILYEQSLRELSRAQQAALETWLTAGGKLIILGSLNYALYQEANLSRLLPVRVSGARRISFTPNFFKNETAAPLANAWVQVATPVGGKVAAEAQGLPLIVEASRGHGRVTYFALDIGRPPLAQWSGLPKVLQILLAAEGGADGAPRSEWSEAIFTQLITSPSFVSTYVPSGSFFLAIVGYLVVIGLLTVLWQRRRVATARALMLFGASVMVASGAGFVYFSRGGYVPDGVLLSSTVLESSADGYADGQANLALFSTQPRQYNLHMGRGWLDMTPVASRARDDKEAVKVRQEGGGSASRYQLPLREWDFRLFRARFVERFAVRSEFAVAGEKLSMVIDNQSDKDLIDAWLLLPGQRHNLGTIGRGTNLKREFALSPSQPPDAGAVRPETVNFREVTFAQRTRDILFHSSFFSREGDTRWQSGGAVFFAWVKDPEPRVRVDDPRIQAQDYALYRAYIPLARGDDE